MIKEEVKRMGKLKATQQKKSRSNGGTA